MLSIFSSITALSNSLFLLLKHALGIVTFGLYSFLIPLRPCSQPCTLRCGSSLKALSLRSKSFIKRTCPLNKYTGNLCVYPSPIFIHFGIAVKRTRLINPLRYLALLIPFGVFNYRLLPRQADYPLSRAGYASFKLLWPFI